MLITLPKAKSKIKFNYIHACSMSAFLKARNLLSFATFINIQLKNNEKAGSKENLIVYQ